MNSYINNNIRWCFKNISKKECIEFFFTTMEVGNKHSDLRGYFSTNVYVGHFNQNLGDQFTIFHNIIDI
jgi:hypothetical protein